MDKRPTIVSTFQHTKTATPVVQNAVRAAVLSVAAEALAEDSSMVRWAAIGRHRLAPKVSVSRCRARYGSRAVSPWLGRRRRCLRR